MPEDEAESVGRAPRHVCPHQRVDVGPMIQIRYLVSVLARFVRWTKVVQ